MNRTHDPEFFTLWDLEQRLVESSNKAISAKDRTELELMEAAFFEKAGYAPAYQGYQAAIENYNKNR